MKFSYNWLASRLNIPVDGPTLAKDLSLAGHEVEALLPVGQTLTNIITGKITQIAPHPNADKLVITQVFDGATHHQIVTGATNIVEGAIVPVSLPGAVLANGTKIKHGNLRGIDSNGMLCSQAELGLVENASGIWLLPEDTPIGVDFVSYAQLSDWILDIGILPNRGDCQSVEGLCRDISAMYDSPIVPLSTGFSATGPDSIYTINIESEALSHHYHAHPISSIENPKSPLWMQVRLMRSGLKSQGLLIDVTNYVLLEMGQPLHAFDASQISGNELSVRQAKVSSKPETITTLDNQIIECPPSTILISDTVRPLAIAGIMGGLESGISAATSSIVVEAAHFNKTQIRTTSKLLGIRTESSARFEKGIDEGTIQTALDRALHLYQLYGNAKICQTRSSTQLKSPDTRHIPYSPDQINSLLGTSFESSEMSAILNRLGIQIDDNVALIPSWRQHDIIEWPCLAEEIARIKGYDHIPTSLPESFIPIEPQPDQIRLAAKAESYLIANGFTQINTFPMVSPEESPQNAAHPALTLTNPITPLESVMRDSLIPSLLKVAAHNAQRQQPSGRYFEIGKTFHPLHEQDSLSKTPHQTSDTDVIESSQLGILMTGPTHPTGYTAQQKAQSNADIFEFKGLLNNILSSFNKGPITFEAASDPQFHPKKCCAIKIGSTLVGRFGQLHPSQTQSTKLTQDVLVAQIKLDNVMKISTQIRRYSPISKFPSTRRDVAFIIDKSIPFSQIESEISKAIPKSVKDSFVFDIFESDAIGSDKKSMAIAFIYQNHEKTLSDDDVNNSHQKLIDKLTKSLPIQIR